MGSRGQSVSRERPSYAAGKHLAQEIFFETMKAIDVRHAMLSRIKKGTTILTAGDIEFPLAKPPRIVAFGKAANRMAAVLVEILGGAIDAGVVVSPAPPAHPLDRLRYFTGGHPYPNAGSLEGAEAALELVSGLTTDDVVIFLVSGGGSALFEKPLDPAVTLMDLLEFNRLLVTCGLPIEQINTLRKHISAVKGGRLAVRAHPARQLTIFISDVPDHLPSMVASGATFPDESTADECYSLVAEHGLEPRLPASIRKHFAGRTLEETPRPGDSRFTNSYYFCLLSNRDAVEAAKSAAEKMDFVCEVDGNNWDADYRQVASANLATLDAVARAHPGQPVCVIVGGEVLCPVTGPGIGGRNQAFVLYSAMKIAGSQRVVLSAGTDGRDGNSPASGAVADGHTVFRARALDMDAEQYFRASDSYHLFRTLGDTLDLGFTDNNVRDIRLWLDFEP